MGDYTSVYFRKNEGVYTKEELIECVRKLRLKYDPLFYENSEVKFSDDLGTGFSVEDDKWQLEFHLGYAGDSFPEYIQIALPDLYFGMDFPIRNNITVFLCMLQDVFEYLRPKIGFGAHELVTNNMTEEQRKSVEEYLFGLNFFGWERLKQLGEDKIKTVPYGKIKRTSAGYIYLLSEFAWLGGDIMTPGYEKKVKPYHLSPDECRVCAHHLGLKSII